MAIKEINQMDVKIGDTVHFYFGPEKDWNFQGNKNATLHNR